MSAGGSVRLPDNRLAARERRTILDTVWVMTLLLVAMSLSVPWFLRSIAIDLAPILHLLLAYGLVYLGTIWLGERNLFGTRRETIFGVVQAVGVMTLAVVWWYAGGIENPLFLFFFALPTTASCLLSRSWLAYATAALSILSVVFVALVDSAALRWYLARSSATLASVFERVAASTGPGPTPFPGYTPAPMSAVITLLFFSVMVVSLAFVSESMNAQLVALYSRLSSSATARTEAETLARRVLQASPDPAVLVAAATGEVIEASDSFHSELLLEARTDLGDRTLGELVEFSYPDVVERLLDGERVGPAVYRIGREQRVALPRSYRFEHRGVDYSHVVLRDITRLYYLEAALDTLDHPYLLVSDDGRLVYCNSAAREVFPLLDDGIPVRDALGPSSTPDGWWTLGLYKKQDRDVHVAHRGFAARLWETPIAGERSGITLIELRREARMDRNEVA